MPHQLLLYRTVKSCIWSKHVYWNPTKDIVLLNWADTPAHVPIKNLRTTMNNSPDQRIPGNLKPPIIQVASKISPVQANAVRPWQLPFTITPVMYLLSNYGYFYHQLLCFSSVLFEVQNICNRHFYIRFILYQSTNLHAIPYVRLRQLPPIQKLQFH
jgi:hypothetical protein